MQIENDYQIQLDNFRSTPMNQDSPSMPRLKSKQSVERKMRRESLERLMGDRSIDRRSINEKTEELPDLK